VITQRSSGRRFLRAFILMSSLAVFGLGGVLASTADLKKLTVFVGPTPIYDSVWMADAMGFYKEEGLDVQFRLFPSGTTSRAPSPLTAICPATKT
jgi:ABC-type nitrate/sulfonate/bicarbonate transport system substrate-binding protein